LRPITLPEPARAAAAGPSLPGRASGMPGPAQRLAGAPIHPGADPEAMPWDKEA